MVYVSSNLYELRVHIVRLILDRMSGLRLPVHVHDAALAVRLCLQAVISQQRGEVMLVAVARVFSAQIDSRLTEADERDCAKPLKRGGRGSNAPPFNRRRRISSNSALSSKLGQPNKASKAAVKAKINKG